MTAVYEATAFPWVVAGAGGVLIGLWLDRASALFDGRNPLTKGGKLRNLSAPIRAIAKDCEMATMPACSDMVNHNTLRAQIFMAGRKLTKLGVSEPYLPADASPWVMFHNVGVMLRAILPAMEEGDVETARYLSGLVREGQIRNPTKEPEGLSMWS